MSNLSNTKGNAFERVIARELSFWLYKDAKSLYRSRGSGSLYTRNSYKSEVSDISPIKTNLYFPLCVEAKNRESDCCPSSLIKLGTKSQLYKWFIKNEKDASSAKLFPILIFKKNFSGTYVLFRKIELPLNGFQITAFRFSSRNVLYLAKLREFMKFVGGSDFLKYLKSKGYKNYGI